LAVAAVSGAASSASPGAGAVPGRAVRLRGKWDGACARGEPAECLRQRLRFGGWCESGAGGAGARGRCQPLLGGTRPAHAWWSWAGRCPGKPLPRPGCRSRAGSRASRHSSAACGDELGCLPSRGVGGPCWAGSGGYQGPGPRRAGRSSSVPPQHLGHRATW